MRETLKALLFTGATALTGCASQEYSTNLATDIKGKTMSSAKYSTERISLDGKTEYIIGEETKDFLLPWGERINSDVVMKLNDAIAYENSDSSQITFAPKDPKNQYAIVPVDLIKTGGKTVLYLVSPKRDRKDIIYLPQKFNINEKEIPKGFSVEGITTNPVEIDQTVNLPGIGESYIFVSKFPVYSDVTESEQLTSEPVMIMSANPKETQPFIDYTDNRRGLKGAFHSLVKLPLAPKPEAEGLEAISIQDAVTPNEISEDKADLVNVSK